MSWDEKVFGFVYGYFAKARQVAKAPAVVLTLEEVRRQSEVLVSALAEQSIEIRDSSGWGGIQGAVLFLPAKIDFLPSLEFQKYYLEWRLLAAVVDLDTGGLPRSEAGLTKAIERFPRLQTNFIYLQNLLNEVGVVALLGESPQWKAQCDETALGMTAAQNEAALSSGTEIQGNSKDRAQRAEIKPHQENPLMHVFEKVMTAEDYQSGNRSLDGSDEMAEHGEALNDLQLSHVIRTQQSSQSLFKSNAIIEVGTIDLQSPAPSEKIYYYPEWFDRQHRYRENWCTLFETKVTKEGPEGPFDQKTARDLRARLESCFSSYQWKSRQKEGPEIDLALAVDRFVQSRVGGALPENIYIKKNRFDQDFAIQILVDTSLSTDSYVNGLRIIDTIQESLNIFAASFSEILDSISIASFSSYTRNQVRYQIVKEFSEDWDSVKRRISTLQPEGYTRIGPALRHSKKRLSEIQARRKMLLLLSDAKPTDYDHYEGHHGIRDIRRAVLELEGSGVKVKVLTLTDKKYSHHNFVFGTNNCVVLKDQKGLADSLFHFWYEAVQ